MNKKALTQKPDDDDDDDDDDVCLFVCLFLNQSMFFAVSHFVFCSSVSYFVVSV